MRESTPKAQGLRCPASRSQPHPPHLPRRLELHDRTAAKSQLTCLFMDGPLSSETRPHALRYPRINELCTEGNWLSGALAPLASSASSTLPDGLMAEVWAQQRCPFAQAPL